MKKDQAPTTEALDVMRTLEQRIQTVERRLLFAATAICLVTAGSVAWLSRANRSPHEMRVSRLVLTDESGAAIAILQGTPSGPLMTFRRDRQTLMVGALASSDMGIALTTEGKASAELSTDANGSSILSLFGLRGDAVASLAVNRERPIMSLRAPESEIGLVATPDVYLKVREKGRVLFQVPPVVGKHPTR